MRIPRLLSALPDSNANAAAQQQHAPLVPPPPRDQHCDDHDRNQERDQKQQHQANGSNQQPMLWCSADALEALSAPALQQLQQELASAAAVAATASGECDSTKLLQALQASLGGAAQLVPLPRSHPDHHHHRCAGWHDRSSAWQVPRLPTRTANQQQRHQPQPLLLLQSTAQQGSSSSSSSSGCDRALQFHLAVMRQLEGLEDNLVALSAVSGAVVRMQRWGHGASEHTWRRDLIHAVRYPLLFPSPMQDLTRLALQVVDDAGARRQRLSSTRMPHSMPHSMHHATPKRPHATPTRPHATPTRPHATPTQVDPTSSACSCPPCSQ